MRRQHDVTATHPPTSIDAPDGVASLVVEEISPADPNLGVARPVDEQEAQRQSGIAPFSECVTHALVETEHAAWLDPDANRIAQPRGPARERGIPLGQYLADVSAAGGAKHIHAQRRRIIEDRGETGARVA